MIAVLLAAGAMLNATATETTALSSAKFSCICWCHPSSSCYLYYSATVTTSIFYFLAIARLDSHCLRSLPSSCPSFSLLIFVTRRLLLQLSGDPVMCEIELLHGALGWHLNRNPWLHRLHPTSCDLHRSEYLFFWWICVYDVYVCIFYIYIYMCVCVYIYIYICVCGGRGCVCVCINITIHIHIHIHIYIYVCVCIYVYVCMHKYVYTTLLRICTCTYLFRTFAQE